LTATDEQIITDLQKWLKQYREIIGFRSPKNNFTDKEILEWRKHWLLPYFDLMLVAKAENVSCQLVTKNVSLFSWLKLYVYRIKSVKNVSDKTSDFFVSSL
jgi:predicted nucleic acid-binding protein